MAASVKKIKGECDEHAALFGIRSEDYCSLYSDMIWTSTIFLISSRQ
jgi:hypothetical protein